MKKPKLKVGDKVWPPEYGWFSAKVLKETENYYD